MDIRFHVDPEHLTLDDRIVLEEMQGATWREIKTMLANNMVDENGAWLDTKAAMKILGGLQTPQLNTALEQFAQAVQELSRSAVPKAQGQPS